MRSTSNRCNDFHSQQRLLREEVLSLTQENAQETGILRTAESWRLAYILKLKNDFCSVNILVDTTYTVQSVDNKHYDLVWNPEHYGWNDFYKVLSIHVDLYDKEIDIALVGNGYCYDSDCAILEGKVLTIMQDNTISKICVEDGALILHKKFECFGCTFGLYRIENGYIVYGELEIVMLDLEFNKVWSFSGRDIFVSQTRESAFVLGEHSIKLYDWEDNYFELDFNGQLIREVWQKCEIRNDFLWKIFNRVHKYDKEKYSK